MLVSVIPESPRWLVIKGHNTQALKVLRFLRRSHECAAKEAGEIKKSAESIPKFTLRKQLHQLYKQHVYLQLAIFLCLLAVKNLSGPYVLEFYSPIIMEEAGLNPHTAATCSVGASELVGKGEGEGGAPTLVCACPLGENREGDWVELGT